MTLLGAAARAGLSSGQEAEIAGRLRPVQLSAWQALQQANVIFVVAAVTVIALAALTCARRIGSGAGRVLAAAGGVMVALVAYRIALPPGPADLLHATWVAFTALAGAATAFIAGLIVHAEESRPAGQAGAPRLVLRGR